MNAYRDLDAAYQRLARRPASSITPDGDLDADYLQVEHKLGRLLDYAVIHPRLRPLYDWSARQLDRPELSDLLIDGTPAYEWPAHDRGPWEPPRLPVPARGLKTLTAPR